MTITVRNIIPTKVAESSQQVQYTATNVTTVIDKFTATNTTSSNVTFSINLVPAGGSASSSNLVLKTRTIAPNETYSCIEVVGQALESGSFISTLAGTAAAIVIRASGREIT